MTPMAVFKTRRHSPHWDNEDLCRGTFERMDFRIIPSSLFDKPTIYCLHSVHPKSIDLLSISYSFQSIKSITDLFWIVKRVTNYPDKKAEVFIILDGAHRWEACRRNRIDEIDVTEWMPDAIDYRESQLILLLEGAERNRRHGATG